MRNFIILSAITLFITLNLTSCGYRIAKKDRIVPKDEVVAVEETKAPKTAPKAEEMAEIGYVKGSYTSGSCLMDILNSLMATGTLLDRDIHGKRLGDFEYRWELIVIRDLTGDVHAAIIENGVLEKIEPVQSLEVAREKFKPYGGWSTDGR
jgi:hypothetical protein